MRPIITHAITGMAVALLMAFFYKPYTTIESADLVYAYNKGVNEALNAEKPSEKLEAVCAALWFKGQQQSKESSK